MRCLFNEQWTFVRMKPGSAYADAAGQQGEHVCLPHDWAIGETERFYQDADGWYFKTIDASEDDCVRSEVFLRFDGVYMDAVVYVNGVPALEHHYGYTAFTVRMTGLLRPGNNEIAVQVRYRCPNSRWYSGAGIFRDVELWRFSPQYLVPDGSQIRTWTEGGQWHLKLRAEARHADGLTVSVALYDDTCLWRNDVRVEAGVIETEAAVDGITPWSVDNPKLYRVAMTLQDQTEAFRIGFREVAFTTDQGLFLNGRRIKLHGVCLHHDLGALGAAFHRDAARRQLRLMKQMGVNAIRTSHNPPASAFLDLCDEMGFLVDDEAYDMWELPKTAFDNARFFPDTWKEDVAAWVRRDRRHPSVIMWSIGNEIQDMFFGEPGYRWTCRLTDEVRLHDRFGHARVTFGSNYLPWEGAQHCAEYVKLTGYNYAEQHYEAHHAAHPDWIIYGSETASMVQSRGVYHFPMSEDILAEEDAQCSALLNSKTSWGTQSVPRMLVEDRLNPYSLGQFIWAGIDYIGEPTPYHTKNSYFGQADTAGFPKDSYYFYRAMWQDDPMIHIGVRWQWNPGQPVDVPVMTNCASAELFLNGVSQGRKTVDRDDTEKCLPVWRLSYADGRLEAVGYDAAGQAVVRDEKCSYGEPAALTLSAESDSCHPGGLAFLTISAVDTAGAPVEDASCPVRVRVTGPACLMGMDNGDSTDETAYQTDTRRLFSGKALAVIGFKAAGTATVRVMADGLRDAELALNVTSSGDSRPLPTVHCIKHTGFCTDETAWIRSISLCPQGRTVMGPTRAHLDFEVEKSPRESGMPIRLRVTNAQGADFPGAEVQWLNDHTARVTARADGAFFLRATADNGEQYTKVLSAYPVTAEGLGRLTLDPYGLVSASLADVKAGEISPGNEQGIAFAREGYSGVGFRNVDFGPVGSDVIELPIFALDANPHDIIVWDGLPDEGGRQLMTCRYQKPSIWNTYQSGFFTLPEVLKGRHDLFLSAVEKVHLKGFRFEPQSRALRENFASDADDVYGDQFTIRGTDILDIGNNVTVTYEHMTFAGAGGYELIITARTSHEETPVILQLKNGAGETLCQTLKFSRSADMREYAFPVQVMTGECQLSLIFLPGTQFDFRKFCFRERRT